MMLTVCNVLVVSLKTALEKTGYNVQNVSDGNSRCVGMEEDFVCEPCQG